EDMILICASVESMRKSYQTMLEAFHNGEFSVERLDESLHRIAEVKVLLKPPLALDADRLAQLSNDIARLNENLNYSYGG
ncbi:MAG TPA: hypothetical protein VEQ34_00550, partial [Pyrinomonadaceae bacterium]|nr:hypothetical protein [Pyrinomonadaceae bacterium]